MQIKQHGMERIYTTEHLKQAVKKITKGDTPERLPTHRPQIQLGKFTGTVINQYSKLSDFIQNSTHIIFIFTKPIESETILTLFSFERTTGNYKGIECKRVEEKISAIKIFERNTDYYVAMGYASGAFSVHFLDVSMQGRRIQIDTKPIRQIINTSDTHFVGLQDYSIYAVNAEDMSVYALFKPTLINCDSLLSISLHPSNKYLLESSIGGYLVVWEIPSRSSPQKTTSSKNVKKKSLKEYFLFPKFIDHSLATEGLIWIDFYGSLIALITKRGVFKLVALDIIGKDVIVLLEYHIRDGESVTHAQIFPTHDCFMVSKNVKGVAFIEKFEISSGLTIDKIVEIKVVEMSCIQNFTFARDGQILMCRNSKQFVIHEANLFSRKQGRRVRAKEEQNDNAQTY